MMVSESPYQAPTSSSQPTAALVSEFAFAGFWKRFVAYFIDGILFGILFWMVVFLFGYSLFDINQDNLADLSAFIWIYVLYYPSWWLYFALMESSSAQGTVGKKVMGIRVTDLQGQPISFGHATGRHFSAFITQMTFTIGFLMAAFTARKQALHDMIASTLVVNSRYGPSQIKVASESPGSGMSVGGILGVIFLILIIPVGGILAAIALPAYQDYTIRAKVSQAMVDTEPLKVAIVDHASESGYWPNTIEQADIDSQTLNNETYFVQMLQDGAYQMTFRKPPTIAENRLLFSPQMQSDGSYEWSCSSSDLKDAHLPPICR